MIEYKYETKDEIFYIYSGDSIVGWNYVSF